MAVIKPFKGIRPPKDLVESVASRPYDVLDSEEARAEAGDNEKSYIISSNQKSTLKLAQVNMIQELIIVLLNNSRSSKMRVG